jgi:hypothetical protein
MRSMRRSDAVARRVANRTVIWQTESRCPSGNNSRDDGAEFPEHDENSGREQANDAQQEESYHDTAGDPKEHRLSPQHRGLRHLDDVEGVALDAGAPRAPQSQKRSRRPG